MSTDLHDDMHEEIHDGLTAVLDRTTPPAPDLAGVVRRRRGLQRRRRVGSVAAAGLLTAAAVAVVTGVSGPETGRAIDPVAPIAPFDVSDGLRAYADPGVEIHLGDRVYDLDGLPPGLVDIDTAGTATPRGVVFYSSEGVPMLLSPDGTSSALVEDAEASAESPDARSDDTATAVGATIDGQPVVVVVDVSTGAELGRLPVEAGTEVEAYDDGTAVLRGPSRTSYVWDVATGSTTELAGEGTVVADLRDGVLLWAGEQPRGPGAEGFRLVEGASDDVELTHDGRWVLDWSSTLQPTDPADEPVQLDVVPESFGWYAVDTDGSVMVAVPDRRGALVHDCEVPVGTCDRLGRLRLPSGDPLFIGVDE